MLDASPEATPLWLRGRARVGGVRGRLRSAPRSASVSGVDERPVVRVNQVGYLPGGPKRAVWIADADVPVPFRVRDAVWSDGGGR